MSATSPRIEARRLRHGECRAAVAGHQRLANWLALLTLLALGIVWH
jgi:hypothetical protein